MKKVTLLFFMVLTLTFGLGKAYSQDLKIGIVDFQKALNEVNEGKAAKARLKSEFDQKQKSLDALQKELQAIRDTLEKQKAVLSQEVLRQKENEYRDKFVNFQKMLSESRGQLQQKEMEATGKIINSLRDIAKQIGDQEKFTVIFEAGSDVVIYAPTATDLTPKLVTMYNSGARGK